MIDNVISAQIINAGIVSAQYPPDLQPSTKVTIKISGVDADNAKLTLLGEHGGDKG